MIQGTIIGSEKIAARFTQIKDKAIPTLQNRITRIVTKLQAYIVSKKLSGQVLKVRTGTLRRSIHNMVTVFATGVTGIVGTNLEYAAVHEYGFEGTENVREHLRTIKQAFGQALKSPLQITVREHTRQVHFPEKSFIRSALADQRADILYDLTSGTKELIAP